VYLKTDGSNTRGYRFNAVLPETTSQENVFENCNINDFIDSAMEGYSATIFAYGQTGSGKTYTMAGEEKRLGIEGWKSNKNDGIIPRSIEYMWEQMTGRTEQFYIKASFAEIYKEQIQDLLNPASGILHCRWNVQNGFFVEDLTVVECTSKDDLIAVLHEGVKNRKTGSHNLNTDSSRSHSILTVYLISETKSDNDIYK
jgi:kinesin family protein 12